MKEIKAFIRTIKAKEVYTALKVNGFCCMTFTECEGTGRYTDPQENFPTLKFPFMHSKVVKIEIVCQDANVEQITEIIREYGQTGRSGDGIIYVMEVEEVYKVRNNVKGTKVFH